MLELSVCPKCKYRLGRSEMPEFAIANLTDVELVLLTPVKRYGYCFSYTGGCNKQLKGALSYYKVSMEGIARGVAHFDVLDMHKNTRMLLCCCMGK